MNISDYYRAVAGILILFAVSGCERSGEPHSEQAQSSSVQQEPAEYKAPDPGFLKAADFPLTEQGRLEGWSFTQHSSNISYSITVDDGVLSITRTGEEPWGKVRQVIRKDELKALQGKTLVFSADIKADFTSEWGQAMEPPALSVLLKGARQGASPFAGASTLINKKEPVASLDVGSYWQRYQLEFTVPPAGEVTLNSLELSFVMTEGGTMYIRGPSLTEVVQ